jgi:hypothetical protein
MAVLNLLYVFAALATSRCFCLAAIESPAKRQDLRGRLGIVPDAIVQRVSHLNLPNAAWAAPLRAYN